MPKKVLENYKAVKIHPISKGLATPTNLSSTGTFEGCGFRRDVYEKAKSKADRLLAYD